MVMTIILFFVSMVGLAVGMAFVEFPHRYFGRNLGLSLALLSGGYLAFFMTGFALDVSVVFPTPEKQMTKYVVPVVLFGVFIGGPVLLRLRIL